jgi:anti-sigma B factor antagonist
MPIHAQDYEKVCVIGLQGDFVGDETAAAITAVNDGISKRQVVDYVLDFQTCTMIDSQGLETMLAIKRKCEELFGCVKLINLDDHCRKILEITRIESRFECCRDLPSALKTMR